MKTQSYKNHIRYYTPHHFVFYPILMAFLSFSIYYSCTKPEIALWFYISVLFVFMFCLSFMLRQHYALILQNRIVKLEFKYNYFTLTGKRFEEIESHFTDSQLFALRFASDEEFVDLINRCLKESLSAEEIKKSIVKWKADNQRV